MSVFALFKKQKIEEGLDAFLAVAQNALYGRPDLAEMVTQGHKMTSNFQLEKARVTEKVTGPIYY